MSQLLDLMRMLRPGGSVSNKGQAALDSKIGNLLYTVAKQDDVKRVLEIGTWNGRGSTYCIALGLGETEGHLITLESNRQMHKRARAFYQGRQLPITLINGSSIAPASFPSLLDIQTIHGTNPHREYWPQWYQQDLECAVQCEHPGVLDDLIARYGQFDLAYLDGGEFTSYLEYLKLRDVVRYLVLDDCNGSMVVKNDRARLELLKNPNWQLLVDEMSDRNGWCAFKRILNSGEAIDD